MPKYRINKQGKKVKKCSVCKKEKDIVLFQRDKSNADGYRYECSSCRSDAVQHYQSKRKKHPDSKVAKEKSRRFFLQEGTWSWIGKKKKRESAKWKEYRARKNAQKERNETDDILDELGY